MRGYIFYICSRKSVLWNVQKVFSMRRCRRPLSDWRRSSRSHTKYDTYYNIPNGARFEKGRAYNYWGLTKVGIRYIRMSLNDARFFSFTKKNQNTAKFSRMNDDRAPKFTKPASVPM